ncbi:MAG: serine hydrolase [Candidatus Heimdallarchaeota archaeon]|nr:serine hydrolase [Candidatus Heimdallarchaeota archaeon]
MSKTFNLQTAKERLDGLDDYLEEAITKRRVPGLGISIVVDNEIIYSKGFGFRDLKKQEKATKKTIFPIGSTTKPFTSTAVAMLVEDGLLEWDTPIRNYCPEFKFKDSYINENVTIRDILGHRTGMPGHDFVWFGFEPTITYMDKIQYLDATKPFRTAFQYCNILYCSTADLIEKLTGKSYSEFVTERILKPLGMKKTFFSREDVWKETDYATLYKEEDGEVIESTDIDLKIGYGSGNINSTAEDMAKFLRFHLNKGKVEGKELLSEENLVKTHLPATLLSPHSMLDDVYPEEKLVHYQSYAHGWINEFYRGNRMNYHAGSYPGCCHIACFLPDLNIGIDILTNTLESFLGHILHYHIIDRLLGLEQIDYLAIDETIMNIMKEQGKKGEEAKEKERIKNTKHSHPLKDYIGKYQHPAYSAFEFKHKDGKLFANFGIHTNEATHYHYDTFEVKLDIFGASIMITFETNQKGIVHGLKIQTEPALEPAFFKKVDNPS